MGAAVAITRLDLTASELVFAIALALAAWAIATLNPPACRPRRSSTQALSPEVRGDEDRRSARPAGADPPQPSIAELNCADNFHGRE
jgi:hypothetical protein